MTETATRAVAEVPGPRTLALPRSIRAHPDRLITLGIFLIALLIRAWGIQWSLPYVGHVDEPKIVDSAVRMMKTGDLNPHLFIWPALVIYIQALVDRVQVLIGTWQGLYPGPEALPDSNHIFALAPGLYLWGRAVSAIIGAAAVAGCYALGRAMFGRPAALVAAGLLLTSPLHVEYSHYLVTDVTMGACGLLALAAAWGLATRPGPRIALLAGAAVGLCAAAKYNGVYIGLAVALAWAIGWWRTRRADPAQGTVLRWLGLAGGMLLAAAAVFLAANPYVLLDWREWSRGFVFQVNAYVPATTLDQVATAFGKQVNALWITDTVLLAAGVLGGLWLLVDALRHRRLGAAPVRAAWLLLPFPLVYTLLMSRFTEVYERNLIIALPCLCLAAGYGAARLASVVSRQRSVVSRQSLVLTLIIGLLLVAEPARRSIGFARYMGIAESRNQAAAWLQDELKAGRRAAVELHPWQMCAPPPYACPAPDVYAPNAPLTEHPPAWYAAHGYDYVVLVGMGDAIVGDPEKEGPRPAGELAPYQALPVVKEWPGDRAGDKGPPVWVVRVGDGLAGRAGVTRSGAHFGDVAELWGYALSPLPTAGDSWDPATDPPAPGPYRPGAAVGVQLDWRALSGAAATPGNWTVALHLDDAAGNTVAQVDVPPISSGRLRPVRDWYANEFLSGAYNIPLPPDLAPGTYRLTLALYDAPAGRTLDVQVPGRPPTSVLDLGAITVAP